MKKQLLLMFATVCMVVHTAAQNFKGNDALVSSGVVSEVHKTGNASGLYSPNLYNGTVNINIPIYDFKIDGVDAGVSLGYNTGGIKVDEIASYVGLGWNLSTGSSITREVYGIEDELLYREIRASASASGPFSLAVPQQAGNWIYSTGAGSENCPDIFTATIGGKSFKFAIENKSTAAGGPNYKVYTYPKQNVLVDILINDNSPNYYPYGQLPANICDDATRKLRFKITDEHGNMYFFDRGDYQTRHYNYRDFSATFNEGDDYYKVAQSWVLSKVITYSGAKIEYTYEEDIIAYPAYNDQRVKEAKKVVFPPTSSSSPTITMHGHMFVINEEVTMLKNVRRIKQIKYPNGDVVTFNTDGVLRKDINISGRAITSIAISKGYSPSHTNTFTYRLNYAYFKTAESVGGRELPYGTGEYGSALRLKLKGIDKIGYDGWTTEKYYSFGYIGESAGEPCLPERLSPKVDCYGYYANHYVPSPYFSTSSPTSAYSALAAQLAAPLAIPLHSFSFEDASGITVTTSYGRPMNPSWSDAQANLIKSIKTGAGGTVSFKYKEHNLTALRGLLTEHMGYWRDWNNFVHDYSSLPGLEFEDAPDGVCISEIETTDGYNSSNNFKDVFTFSNGVSFFSGGYFWKPTWLKQGIENRMTSWAGPGDETNEAIYKVYQNSFVTQIDYVNGFNHGYSNARVETFGYDGARLRMTDYSYTNLITQSGEKTTQPLLGTVDVPGFSRLTRVFGLYGHALPRIRFQKQYLGLPKSVKHYTPDGTLLSEEHNNYSEKRFGDSLDIQFFEASFTWGASPGGSTSRLMPASFANSRVELESREAKTYLGSAMSTITYNYTYDGDGDLVEVAHMDSKGNVTSDINKYVATSYSVIYTAGGLGTYTSPIYKIFSPKWLVEKSQKKLLAGGGTVWNSCSEISADLPHLVHYAGETYRYYDGLGGFPPDADGKIGIKGVIPNVFFDKVNGFYADEGNLSGTSAPRVQLKRFSRRDNKRNIVETIYRDDDPYARTYGSAIWDGRIGHKVAEVTNAKYDAIAYTSFEGSFGAGIEDDKGNWNFPATNVHMATGGTDVAMTGRYYCDFGGFSGTISSVNTPEAGKDYIVSFWFKGGTPTVTYASAAHMVEVAATVGDWKLGIVRFTAATFSGSLVTVTASGQLDELRMHPADAAMTTTTFEPLIGVSSTCDERNNIVYQEYDAMGRPTVTRDVKKNILSLMQHTVQGTDH